MPYRYADNTSAAVPPSMDGIVEIESTNLARRIREAEIEYGFEIDDAKEFSTAGCFSAGLTDGESWMWKMWGRNWCSATAWPRRRPRLS
jgi:hypothetical protein